MNQLYRVEPIADHPDLISMVGRWHWGEWGHADPGGSLESWTASLREAANREKIPMVLVAFAGDEAVGSVSLVANDMNTADERWRGAVERWRRLTPWLSGLYVVPEHRGRGVGSDLVRACEMWARNLGATHLYLYTSTAEEFYSKHGYTVLGRDVYQAEPVAVMGTDLVNSSGPS